MPNLSYYKLLREIYTHRTATPIDHPDNSITRAKMEYPTEDVTFVYLLSINKAIYTPRIWHDASGIIASDEFTDKAVESPIRDGGGIYGRDRLDGANSYRAGITVSRTTNDFFIQRMINGTITDLATEAVDLSDIFYSCKFSISGSTLKAYRVDLATPKITATDTDITSGYFGIGYWNNSAKPVLTMAGAMLRAPSSPAPQVVSYLEVPVVGSGTPEDPFRPQMPEEIVDHPLHGRVNRLALTWSAVIKSDITGKPQEYTSIVRVFHQPDRPAYLYPLGKVLGALQNTIGVRKLTREEAIRRAKQLDDKLHPYDLERTTPTKDKVREYKEWRIHNLGVREELINEEQIAHYIGEDKGW